MANNDESWRLRVSQAVRDTPGLPPEDIASVDRLLDADEWALAFETFCTQLYEHQVVLPDGAYDHFHHLAHQLNVDRRVVWLLRDHAAQVTSRRMPNRAPDDP